MNTVRLGYELGTGVPVDIPIRHLAVTGQTQESGKTTTLEALVARSGLPAIAFVTKRGEGAFREGRRIPPYFRERADWQFVASVLEATMREKLKFERAWIMRASKGAQTLQDVQRNVRTAMEKAKGLSADVYLTLDHYLDIVIPQIRQLKTKAEIDVGGAILRPALQLSSGLNVMDLGDYTMEMQALIIRSVLEWVYREGNGVVTIIPEAWEFIPQNRGSPVLLAAEILIRKGAGIQNYLWLDSQDLAAVHKNVLRSVIVWLLGVQREANEVKRALLHIPPSTPKPTTAEVMGLGVGQFIACWGGQVKRVYVQPAWMSSGDAQAHAVTGDAIAGLQTLQRALKKARVVVGGGTGVSVGRGSGPRLRTPGALAERNTPRRVDAGSTPALAPSPEDMEEAAEALRQQMEADEMDRIEREAFQQRIATLDRELDAERKERAYQASVALKHLSAGQALEQLRELLVGPGVVPNGLHVMSLDQEQLIAEILRRLPAGGGGAVYQVAPVEKLRKDYQQREVTQILEQVQAFTVTGKDILALVEMVDGFTSQPTLAKRLGKGPGGWMVAHIKPLVEGGFVELIERQGLRRRLRAKIAEDLAHYQAAEAEIEAVYQQVVATIATGAPARA